MKQKKLDIIYEDKDIIVINKPCKLLCVSTEKEKEKTLFYEVSLYVKKKYPKNKVFIVHRLDKDTSGIVVFAKNEKIKNDLQNNWDKYAINREYIALVNGKVKNKEGTLKNRLCETSTNLVYVDDENKNGKLAITKYKLIKYIDNNSLLDINILTGRKNQIRVQLMNMGNCIIGDTKYGKKRSYLNRLMLHASKLELFHPSLNKTIVFEAKLPKEFKLLS